MLGLPDGIRAVLFDMDGVLTETATVHARAWKSMFDDYLRKRDGDGFKPFSQDDYDQYVDGKPRYDGVRSFLQSRGIDLAQGKPSDSPGAETIDGLGNRKNELVLKIIHDEGVKPYPGSVRYVDAVREAGLRRAVVSSSANTKDVLRSAGILDRFEKIVDGHVVEDEGLKGKPAPDTYLQGAEELGLKPSQAAVFEDALSGVEAGRAGRFGYVVGVDRVGQADALEQHGADVVVKDLADLL
ncbi:MAG TPA: beta-phosphoglucomutase family hydrolase [Solirubrobacteraceae bacterium]|nr:beta-phosphoglucomutase family hydrolase [Solirubrobacteraceae bacterium]